MNSRSPDPADDEILEPELTGPERDALLETAQMLEEARPAPRPGFRGRLARQLQGEFHRPRRAPRLIAAYASSGLALLAFVAAGLAGLGPFAA
jgi:hypothetical protein